MNRAQTPRRRWLAPWWAGLVLATFTGVAIPAVKRTERFTLLELHAEPGLTPARFADLFEYFSFELHRHVQPPETFLANQSGDCDDYAILADHVLSRRGLRTRIVQVRLVGTNVDHAVCYVVQNKAYLDYNNRQYSVNLEKSRPFLRDIAEKVADSFERNWTVAYEYTFDYAEGVKRKQAIVIKTDDPRQDADRLTSGRPSP